MLEQIKFAHWASNNHGPKKAGAESLLRKQCTNARNEWNKAEKLMSLENSNRLCFLLREQVQMLPNTHVAAGFALTSVVEGNYTTAAGRSLR